ncbi:calcium-binding protein [Dankookia sp. P2]|uniref:calcium-binding protein n=1 Tax=Dankookia sp. P2 TaxID=3423955 RepID=UPI003D66F0C5
MAIFLGTDIRDVLTGTDERDQILTFGGDDEVYGLGGDDLIRLGDGTDAASGGPGNDLIFGEAGNDKLRGDEGNDRIYGGEGSDGIIGGAGADTLSGGSDSDVFIFAPGDSGTDAATRDLISDFQAGPEKSPIDVMNLQGFRVLDVADGRLEFIGTAPFGGGDFKGGLQVRYDVEGNETIVRIGFNTGQLVAEIELHGRYDLHASDFLL